VRIVRGCLILCALVLTLSATTSLYDNLSATVSDFYSATEDGPLYASFSTGGTTFSLTDVQILLVNGTDLDFAEPRTSKVRSHHKSGASRRATRPSLRVRPEDGSGGSITVALYSDNDTSPSGQLTVIGTLPDSSLPTSSSGGAVDFPLATAYPLAANTRYWIGLTSSNDSVADWLETNVTTGTGVAGEFLFADDGVMPNNPETEPFIMQVDNGSPSISPTPAPPTLVLGLLGIACLGLYFARRRFATRPAA